MGILFWWYHMQVEHRVLVPCNAYMEPEKVSRESLKILDEQTLAGVENGLDKLPTTEDRPKNTRPSSLRLTLSAGCQVVNNKSFKQK